MEKDNMSTVVFAGGKTGGHLFPGLAVAHEMRNRGHEVGFIGSAGGLEEKLLPKTPFFLELIKVGGLKGKNFLETVKNIMILPVSLLQAMLVIKKYKVDVLVSLGGYAAGPAALAAKICGCRVVVMEQNAIPGITNRIIGRFSHKNCLSFPDEKAFFNSEKSVVTGNPVRKEIYNASPAEIDTDKPVCAVFGGSQGAVSMNSVILKMFEENKNLVSSVFMLHQAGSLDRERVENFYIDKGIENITSDFFDNIGSFYKRADLVVCRAGATTIAELVSLGKYAVYIPLPHAADNHQYHNARAVEKISMGEIVDQTHEKASEKLADIVFSLLEDRDVFLKHEKTEVSAATGCVADEIENIMCKEGAL
ncbi:MAG: undecaprenyldiphospho-muramoylpentapeptide beta-N-acetylglucosaminyltransferase [bacterium]